MATIFKCVDALDEPLVLKILSKGVIEEKLAVFCVADSAASDISILGRCS